MFRKGFDDPESGFLISAYCPEIVFMRIKKDTGSSLAGFQIRRSKRTIFELGGFAYAFAEITDIKNIKRIPVNLEIVS